MAQERLKIFISAVTSEFGKARDALAADLRARGHTVTVQSDFTAGIGLLRVLAEHILTCDVVVFLIGERSGSVPPSAAVESFQGLLPAGLEEATYAQWELFLARHFQRRSCVYIARPDYQPDLESATGDRPDLQKAYVNFVKTEAIHYRSFSNVNELRSAVLHDELKISASLERDGQSTELRTGSKIELMLSTLSYENLRVVSTRAGLRAIPLLTAGRRRPVAPEFASACLSAFSSAAKAWFASKYPARQNLGDFTPAPFPAGNYEDDFGILIAGLIVSATQAGVTSWSVAEGIERIEFIAGRADDPASAKIFNMALSDDVRDLKGASAPAIAGIALWPGRLPPNLMSFRWNRLKRDLIESGVGWEVWVDWYEDRLRGDVRSDARELAYIEVPAELLFDGPAKANSWIRRQIAKSHHQREGITLSGSVVAPSVPAAQPAAIEPVWQNRRLTLPKVPSKTDLSGRKFAAALKSLRQEMRALAADISSELNIDKRFAAYVSTLAEGIPVKPPRQAELFRLGHAESVFAGYSKTVNEEWPAILAARYHALSLSFDRTLRQSPLWREFKRNAARELLTPEQIRTAATLAADVAVVLRSDEAKELIDPAIPRTLMEVAGPLQSAIPPRSELPERIIEAGDELVAYDLVESINNILKSIFRAAILTRISRTAQKVAHAYTEEALKSIIGEAKRLGTSTGPALSKWTQRFILGGAGFASYQIAGKSMIIWLVTNYPEAFKWLEAAAHFLSAP